MKNAMLLLLSILLFAAMASAPVLAGEVTTITEVVNIDGKIGLYIRNDLGLIMQTDNSKENLSVLSYTVDNKSVFSIYAKSAKGAIKTEETKLIVIDAEWPKTGYSTIKVTYTDIGGLVYDPETAYAFAKSGITLEDSWTEPEVLSSNSSFTIHFKIKAGGEGEVTGIDAAYITNPKYFTYATQTNGLKSIKQGETSEYSFTYKLSGQSMPDTVVYETISAPVAFTFTYLSKNSKLTVNQSILLYNKQMVGNSLPELKTLIDIPNTMVQDSAFEVPVYAWNSKAGSHSACNLNITLTETTGQLKIPISNILPSDLVFPPASEQSSEPAVKFAVEVPATMPEGNYELVLDGRYLDCEWKAPSKLSAKKQFSVVKKTVINESTEPSSGNVTNPPGEKIGGLGEKTTAAAKEGLSKAKNYIIAFGLLLAAIVGVVFVLERRGRRI